MSLGVHCALDAQTAGRLLAAPDDDAVAALIEEIEEEMPGVDHCDTDKAWDAIHRSLTDGHLGDDNGAYPLNAAVFGGRQLHDGDDYTVALLAPNQVQEVAAAVAVLDRETFRAGYDRIEAADYGPEFGDEDFVYTWSNFTELVEFFQRAAGTGAYVVFTVGF